MHIKLIKRAGRCKFQRSKQPLPGGEDPSPSLPSSSPAPMAALPAVPPAVGGRDAAEAHADLLSRHLWQAGGRVRFLRAALALALRDTLSKDPQRQPSESVPPPAFPSTESHAQRAIHVNPAPGQPAVCEHHRAPRGISAARPHGTGGRGGLAAPALPLQHWGPHTSLSPEKTEGLQSVP